MEFQQLIPDEMACAWHIGRIRWPRGFECPSCGQIGDPWHLQARPHVLECRHCGHQASLIAGTLMHRTRQSLVVWFWAAYLVTTQTPGMSALHFQRQLGISRYETALHIQKSKRREVITFQAGVFTAKSVRYCGREFIEDELTQIRQLIVEDLERNRAELSRLTYRALKWFKADGGLKEMSARIAMLRMQEDGLITLPPPRCKRPDTAIHRTAAGTDPGASISQPAGTLIPLILQRLKNKPESRLCNEYIERYHYMGYKPQPGAQLCYFVHSGSQPIVLLGFGAAAWQIALRDRFIAWSHDQRKKKLHLIVNNARFLILPWVQSKNLASMILAMAAK